MGLPWRRCSGQGPHPVKTLEPRRFSRVASGFSKTTGISGFLLVILRKSDILFSVYINGKPGEKRKMENLTGADRIEEYFSYEMHEFSLDNCLCKVVEPANPLPGRPWIWKAEFFSAFPKFELKKLTVQKYKNLNYCIFSQKLWPKS